MKAVPSGAGRYIWCQSQLVWLNMAMAARLEDLEGAFSANQSGLTRYSAIALGEDCAVILALALTNEGLFPGVALARDWNKMVDELHQESFFPKEWIRSAAPKSAAT